MTHLNPCWARGQGPGRFKWPTLLTTEYSEHLPNLLLLLSPRAEVAEVAESQRRAHLPEGGVQAERDEVDLSRGGALTFSTTIQSPYNHHTVY